MSLLPLSLILFMLISHAAVADSIKNDADRAAVTIDGHERIHFQTPGEKGVGRFCVRHNLANRLEKKWRVVFLMPAGGLKMSSPQQYADPVPFELTVEPALGGHPVVVHDGSILSQGAVLSSHCSDPREAFFLKVSPAIAGELITGGFYSQRIQLKLYVDDTEEDTFDIQLGLDVAERVNLKIPGFLQLPDFDGHNSVQGEIRACVFRNGGGRYAIRMRGEGEQGAFILSDGQENLAFQALWRSGNHSSEPLETGDISRAYRGASDPGCHGSPNAMVMIRIPTEDARQVTSGRYQGLLRITIETR